MQTQAIPQVYPQLNDESDLDRLCYTLAQDLRYPMPAKHLLQKINSVNELNIGECSVIV